MAIWLLKSDLSTNRNKYNEANKSESMEIV